MGDTHFVTLPDGRQLSYSEYGDPAGPVLLYCVGTPESRLLGHDEIAGVERAGIRYLAPDRPGFGQSDPKPGRTLTDWPLDAAGLMDALGIGEFAVLGASGGGPYAVACGVVLGDRVRRVALASPAAPAAAPEHGFVPREEAALRARGEDFARLLRDDPAGFYAYVMPDLSESDRERELGMTPAQLERTTENFREAFRQGSDAYVEDHLLNASDWADLLPRLTRPTRIWAGLDDNNTPHASSAWMAERIPGAELTAVQGGHGLTEEAWPQILSWATTGRA